MSLPASLEQAYNEQINAEMYSAYLYLSMSADFEAQNLKGFASWMKVQAQEEMAHAMKFYNFVQERGGKVELLAMNKPPGSWENPTVAFEAAFQHEQMITSRINKLVELAAQEKDFASNGILQWFTDEQVEEEASVDEVLQKLKLAKDAPGAIFMIDKEMEARVFVPNEPAN